MGAELLVQLNRLPEMLTVTVCGLFVTGGLNVVASLAAQDWSTAASAAGATANRRPATKTRMSEDTPTLMGIPSFLMAALHSYLLWSMGCRLSRHAAAYADRG